MVVITNIVPPAVVTNGPPPDAAAKTDAPVFPPDKENKRTNAFEIYLKWNSVANVNRLGRSLGMESEKKAKKTRPSAFTSAPAFLKTSNACVPIPHRPRNSAGDRQIRQSSRLGAGRWTSVVLNWLRMSQKRNQASIP